MVWSYDTAEPTARDQVRGIIGDVDQNKQLLQNETIDAVLTRRSNAIQATAAECLRRLIARFSKDTDRNAIGINNLAKQRIDNWRETLNVIIAEDNSLAGGYAGGVSKADKDSINANTDNVGPLFQIEQHDMKDNRGRNSGEE